MKKPTLTLILSAFAGCLLLLGCSKAKNDSSQSPASSGATSATSSEAIELKAKWAVEKKYLQRMEMGSTTEMNMPQSKKPIEQVTTICLDYAISALKEREGGGRELEVEFLGNKLDVKTGERALISFDSKDEAANTNSALSVLRKLVGSRIRFLVDAQSKVEKVEGYEEFLARISEDKKSQASGMAKAMFNEDMLRQLINSADVLPDHPVKVGDKWPHKTEMNMGPMGKMVVDVQYTFAALEPHGKNQCARLDFAGTMSTPKPEAAAAGAASVEIENGKISGTTWFDPELGTAVDTQTDQSMNIKIKTAGQSLSNKTSQKVSLKLTEVVDLEK